MRWLSFERSLHKKADHIASLPARMATILFLASVALPSGSCIALAANLTVRIDLSDQEMQVSQDGRTTQRWAVSTARRGYHTPIGTFKPTRLERTWYSRKYNYSPMPFSIFFLGGYAIHGTEDLRNLGNPASHGCIRLDPSHARILFDLVLKYGKASTDIVIRR